MSKIKKTERHVRWNWEQSPEDGNLVRYHFVIIDDRDREGVMRKITEQLLQVNPIEPIRSVEGKVQGTKYRYLFNSYDTVVAPRMIAWSKVGKPIKRDKDLRERKVGNIEDYVAEVYS